jgi:hypothetical protein
MIRRCGDARENHKNQRKKIGEGLLSASRIKN